MSAADIIVRSAVVCAVACAAITYPGTAVAQQPRPATAAPAPRQPLAIRGFGDIGAMRFAAGETFKATLGSSTGVFFGGGVEVVLPQRLFFNVRLSRFQKSGERVFVDGGEVFPLGIDMKVAIKPVEVSGGYRFQPQGDGVIPYVGGGVGWHRYSETSDFAGTSEDVSETFNGYHALGGVEFRMGQLFAVAGEAQWTSVPDAFGGGSSSAAGVFDETNLGGISFRIRVTIGR